MLRGHERGISAELSRPDFYHGLAISADSHRLATSGTDGIVRLWDLTAKDPAAKPVVLRGHQQAIYGVAISPDNHWLVTAGRDGTTRLWDLTTKDPAASPVVLHVRESDLGIFDATISQNNHWLATGGDDGIARLWLMQVSDLIDLARVVAGRNLTADESKLYFPDEPYHKTFPDLPGP